MSQKKKTYRGVVYHYDSALDFKIYKMNHLTDLPAPNSPINE